MGQLSFFEMGRRYEFLIVAGNPLERLKKLVPWEIFRKPIEKELRGASQSEAGRKPYDAVMMFKILVLQRLYALSDQQTQYQINDRLSFQIFLGLEADDMVPDQKTIWLFREQLTKCGLVEKLFKLFEKNLKENGYRAQKGSLLDASIVEVPIQRNKNDENKRLKEDKVPEEWKEEPNKLRQKDVDAKWTKKHGKSYYGYKNHVNADRKHKIIREYKVTPASTNESVVAEELIDEDNTNKTVWADSAYDTQKIHQEFKDRGYKDKIQRKGRNHNPLSERQRRANETRAKVRKFVEHVFGFQVNSMKADFIRTVGVLRATAVIGLNNLVYNLTRFARFESLKLRSTA